MGSARVRRLTRALKYEYEYEWVGGDEAFPEARALQYFPRRWQT